MAREKKTEASSLENSMEALERVIEKLEKEDVSLEESFQFYQQGMKLLKDCNDAIDKVEKKLIVLSNQQDE